MFDDTTVPAAREPSAKSRGNDSPAWAAAKRTQGEWDPHASSSLQWVAGLVRRARGLPPERNPPR